MSYSEASERIIDFVKNCDLDTLAAIFEYTFNGEVIECYENDEDLAVVFSEFGEQLCGNKGLEKID
jgi:hypothetical protein